MSSKKSASASRVGFELNLHTSYRLWGAEIGANPPTVDYSAAMDTKDEKGVGTLTKMIVS
jgi:hypothetical protein